MNNSAQTQAVDVRYALAPDFGAGAYGLFIDGPRETLPPEWLARDGLIFQVELGGQPALALDAVLPLADRMGEAMYRHLQSVDEGMALAAARGEDADVGFTARWRAVEALMDASPWMFHPDHGLVRKSEYEAGADTAPMTP